MNFRQIAPQLFAPLVLGALGVVVLIALDIAERGFGAWAMGLAPYAAGAAGIGVVGGGAAFALKRWQDKRRMAAQAQVNAKVASGPTLVVLPRPDWKRVEISKVALWNRLADILSEHVAFELTGNEMDSFFTLHAAEGTIDDVITQMGVEWINVERRPLGNTPDPATARPGESVCWIELTPTSGETAITPVGDDPLLAVMTYLAGLPDTSRGFLQIVARPDAAHRAALRHKADQLRVARTVEGQTNRSYQAYLRAETQKQKGESKEIEGRLESSFFSVTIRCAIFDPDPKLAGARAQKLAKVVAGQFKATNPMKLSKEQRDPSPLQKRALGTTGIWADDELASLAHLTGENALDLLPSLRTASAVNLPPSRAMIIPADARRARICGAVPEAGGSGAAWIQFGTNFNAAGVLREVGTQKKSFQKHTLVVGTTGSGKSTYLTSLSAQAFDLGDTVIIAEPHGDLCQDAMKALHFNHLHHLCVIDLNSEFAPCIPLMSMGLDAGFDVARRMVENAIRDSEPASWDQAIQMRTIISNAIKVVLDAERGGASLVSLQRFLTVHEAEYRRAVLARVSDKRLEEKIWWEKDAMPQMEAEKGGGDFRKSVSAAHKRIGALLDDGRFRRVLALPPLGPQINIKEMLGGGRMVLIPLNAAEIGKPLDKMFGMVMMDMVRTAFLSRTDREARPQAFVIFDETAAMADSSGMAEFISDFVAQLRKFGASGVFATQSLEQLTPDVRKELEGNTNNKVVLLVQGKGDSRMAVDILSSDRIKETDVTRPPKWHGFVKAIADDAPQPACLVKMLPPVTLADPGRDSLTLPNVERVSLSAETRRVMELAKGAHNPKNEDSADAAIAALWAMDDAAFFGTVEEIVAQNRYIAAGLLNNPRFALSAAREAELRQSVDDEKKIEDEIKVVCGRKVSGLLYGLQWWARESYAKRLRYGRRGERRPQPSKEKEGETEALL